MQTCHCTVDTAFFFSLHISTVLLFLIRLLTEARLHKPNYYVENTIFPQEELTHTFQTFLAVKTGKSVEDKRAGKGISVISGNCPPQPPPPPPPDAYPVLAV